MRIGGGAVSIADVTNRTARDLGFVRPFWLNEIRAGRAFTFPGGLGAVAGQNGHIQLFNPAASGITVILYQVPFSFEVAQRGLGRLFNTELTTDAGAGINLLNGGLAGLAHVRTQTNAGVFGTALFDQSVLADTPTKIFPEWSMELGEGEGVIIVANTVNTVLRATYFWIEL